MLAVFLLQAIVKISVNSTKLSTADQVRVAVVQDKLQLLLDHSSVDRANSDKQRLRFINNSKQKQLEAYTNRSQKLYLRLKNADGGYQPVLGGLKAIQMNI